MSKHVHVGKNITARILGFPIEYQDVIKNTVNLKPQKSTFQNSPSIRTARYEPPYRQHQLLTPVNFHFEQRVISFHFFTIMDILSQIGGIGALIFGIASLFGSIFIVQYIFELSKIIERQNE